MRLLKITAYITAAGALTALIAGGGVFYYLTKDLPSINALYDYRPNLITKAYSHDGRPIGEFYIERRIVVSLSSMPDHLVDAFISAEDSNFFVHEGVDWLGVVRAFYKNMTAGRIVQGGSTITQQVARSFFLSQKRRYSRKFKEAVLAYRIENNLTKEDILHLYLNQIYLGNGAYGVQAAAETYFGKDIGEVTIAEAALLAGLPKAPSRYSPYTNLKKATSRQEFILTRMLEEGHITREEADVAIGEPLVLKPKKAESLWAGPYFTEHIRRYIEETYGEDLLYKGGLQIYTTMDVSLQKAANDAVNFGLRSHDKRRGYRGPPMTLTSEAKREKFKEEAAKRLKKRPVEVGRIYKALVTSVEENPLALRVDLGGPTGTVNKTDMAWAKLYNPTNDPDGGEKVALESLFTEGDVIEVLVKYVPEDDETPLSLRLEQEPLAEAALFAIEPRTGYVKAMIGGSGFSKTQFNRAIQARRQPGSAFKPVIYATALDSDYTAASIVVDSPLIFVEETATTTTDTTIETVAGEEDTEAATAAAAEAAATETLKKTWKPRNYGKRFYGKTTIRTALTKSRNVVTIKLLREIGVGKAIEYAKKLGIESPLARDLSLALGSSAVSLMEITRAYATFANLGVRPDPIYITKIVDRNGNVLEEHTPRGETVISPQTSYIITNLLQGVVEEGTGRRARSLGRPVAGKTGTTNDLNDAWFIGFSPELAAGVWIGFDSEKPLGIRETGSRAAAPIWIRFMKKALKDVPKSNFPIPPGVEFAKIDRETGLLAGPWTKKPIFEVFKVGTAPTVPATSDKKDDAGDLDFFMLEGEEVGPDTPGLAPIEVEDLNEEDMI